MIPTLAFGATQMSNLGNPNVHFYGPLGGFEQNARSGNYVKAARDLIRDEIAQFTGFDINGIQGNWELPRATALLFASGLISKYLGKYVNPSLRGIPMIGKKIVF